MTLQAPTRLTVSHFGAAGIIYRKKSPGDFLAEIKDGTYPVRVFANHVCAIGGNYLGPDAMNDLSPRSTFVREATSELSFEKPITSTLEIVAAGEADEAINYVVEPCKKDPMPDDQTRLTDIKAAILEGAIHQFDYIVEVPETVFRGADANWKKGGKKILMSFFGVPLEEETWKALVGLQNTFGNLSNESVTIVTSLDEVVTKQQAFSWGYDQVFQQFFIDQGLARQACRMKIMRGINVQLRGGMLGNYRPHYFRAFNVENFPKAA